MNGNKDELIIKKKIDYCIDKSLTPLSNINRKQYETNIYSYYNLPQFIGKSFSLIDKGKTTKLSFEVSLYDNIDGNQEATIRANELIKFLTIIFNIPVFLGRDSSKEKKDVWRDCQDALEEIDTFLSFDIFSSTKYNKLIDASTSFYNASKILYNNKHAKEMHVTEIINESFSVYNYPAHEKLLDIYPQIKIDVELAVVSFINALEALSSLTISDDKSCPQCNQKIYAISKKIRDLALQFGGKEIERNIKSTYNFRSQIVHAGLLIERQDSYCGVTNPRMDISNNGKLVELFTNMPNTLSEDVRVIFINFVKFINQGLVEAQGDGTLLDSSRM